VALQGEWRLVESDAEGEKHLFVDSDNTVQGYVLTQQKCEQRMEMDRLVGELA